MQYIVVYLIIINLVTCILYGIDKLKSMSGGRRIPEKRLLGFTLAGGSIGAWIGMQVFRHKTRHFRFQVFVPLSLVLHVALVAFVYGKWFS